MQEAKQIIIAYFERRFQNRWQGPASSAVEIVGQGDVRLRNQALIGRSSGIRGGSPAAHSGLCREARLANASDDLTSLGSRGGRFATRPCEISISG